MTTEIIDKLYLELSQVTTATTAREQTLIEALEDCIEQLEMIPDHEIMSSDKAAIEKARKALNRA